MPEQVSTGGLKTFDYNKNINLVLDDERKRDINEAYDKYYQRKDKDEKQKKRNWIILIIIILIALILIGIWVFNR